MRRTVVLTGLVCGVAAAVLTSGQLFAGSHLWKFSEVFSNADGSVQFIELHECCGAASELYLGGLELTSEATGNIFRFPRHLTGSTSNRFLLLATESFSPLPGAPAPDFIIPEGFVGTTGDTLWYSEARRYDRFDFAVDDLPTDGVRSIHVTDYTTDAFVTDVNSPTNYDGAGGSVVASYPPFSRADCNTDGDKDISDVIFVLGTLFTNLSPLTCDDACDANDDGVVDISDAVSVLLFLFDAGRPLPEPVVCGADAGADQLGCRQYERCS